MNVRALKSEILHLLDSEDFRIDIESFRFLPGRKAVNPLFSFLHHPRAVIRWHAVSAMGVVVATLANSDMESARNVMRRLIWNLNDESGGIGWGSPEAMGDILARHEPLSREFSKILRSYVMPQGNFLEHELLQKGVLWGLARLAAARPAHVTAAGPFLIPFTSSGDPDHRGLAALACGALRHDPAAPHLESLVGDSSAIEVYDDLRFRTFTVGGIAAAALARLRTPS